MWTNTFYNLNKYTLQGGCDSVESRQRLGGAPIPSQVQLQLPIMSYGCRKKSYHLGGLPLILMMINTQE